MQKNWNETQLDYFKLCKLLKNAGYKEGSDKFFIEYQEDYVYDEDPNHPESHKKGEIRVYPRYYKNSNEEPNYFEMPTLEDINMWLLNETGFYVCIKITDGRYFDYDIYKKVENLTFVKYRLVSSTILHITSPDETYINAFLSILNYLYDHTETL